MMAAEVHASGSSFSIGTARALFETRPYRAIVTAYDVSADGQRFVIPFEPAQASAAIALVENWDAELKRK